MYWSLISLTLLPKDILWILFWCCKMSAVLCCGVLWCGVVWCDVLYCGVVCCGVVYCAVLWCGVLCWSVVWCDVLCCGVVCCGVVWCAVLSHMSPYHGSDKCHRAISWDFQWNQCTCSDYRRPLSQHFELRAVLHPHWFIFLFLLLLLFLFLFLFPFLLGVRDGAVSRRGVFSFLRWALITPNLLKLHLNSLLTSSFSDSVIQFI